MKTPEEKQLATARATAKKRATWERLVGNPDAAPAMRAIIAYEDERFHATCHVNDWPYVQCGGLCPMRHDREHALLVEQACEDLRDAAQWKFYRRFDVTMGYYKRLHSHIRLQVAKEWEPAVLPR